MSDTTDSGTLGGIWDWIGDTGGSIVDYLGTDQGQLVGGGVLGLGLNYLNNTGGGSANITPSGYQGGIPDMQYNREVIQQPNDPNRRPGEAGRRYFTDGNFTSDGTMQGIQNSSAAAGSQFYNGGGNQTTQPVIPNENEFAHGGIAQIHKNAYAEGGSTGRYLRGASDGMGDEINTSIDGEEPAALSHGEFVIPADVVSHLGNGNSDAGAKMLEQMMSRIRKERTGNDKQGKEIEATQFLPK